MLAIRWLLMKKEIEFKCPRCSGKAFYYGGGRAACINHGWLLYTEIPPEIYTPSSNWLLLTDFSISKQTFERKISSLIKKVLAQIGGK